MFFCFSGMTWQIMAWPAMTSRQWAKVRSAVIIFPFLTSKALITIRSNYFMQIIKTFLSLGNNQLILSRLFRFIFLQSNTHFIKHDSETSIKLFLDVMISSGQSLHHKKTINKTTDRYHRTSKIQYKNTDRRKKTKRAVL